MKLRQFAGLAMLLTVALVIVTGQFFLSEADQQDGPDDPGTEAPSNEPITIGGNIGGKIAFLSDPDVVTILKDRYGLTVEFRRVGSFEMIEQCKEGLDYCWPSSQNAGEIIKDNLGPSALASEIIFSSPLVLYTWTPIADALIANGFVEQRDGTYFLTDLARLVQMIEEGTEWSALGLDELNGPITIRTSDPVLSNTGNSFCGLLANTLNGGRVVDSASADKLAPRLVQFFANLGLMPDTTTLLFEQFMTLGIGAEPIIAAYESNLIEYTLLHHTDQDLEKVQTKLRTLYPDPTVWTSQPLIALTEGGQRFMGALRDPEIQRIGWEHHGFRPAVPSVNIDVSLLSLPGVPVEIISVVPMPAPAVMDRIITALRAPSSAPSQQASPVASEIDRREFAWHWAQPGAG